MKLLIFYLKILLPLPLIIVAKEISPLFFFLFLFLYIFLYRPEVESQKLIKSDIIQKKEKWKFFFIPFFSIKYFEELFFIK